MIIDPPSVFSPVEEWTSFRKDMELALASDPDNLDILEAIAMAKKQEAQSE